MRLLPSIGQNNGSDRGSLIRPIVMFVSSQAKVTGSTAYRGVHPMTAVATVPNHNEKRGMLMVWRSYIVHGLRNHMTVPPTSLVAVLAGYSQVTLQNHAFLSADHGDDTDATARIVMRLVYTISLAPCCATSSTLMEGASVEEQSEREKM